MGALSLLVTGVFTPAAMAQEDYDWTVASDAAAWGTNNTSGGSYARSSDTSASGDGRSRFVGTNEAPIDGGSGLILFSPGEVGVVTRTDVDSVFDLSEVGSSVTTRFAYHLMDKYPNTGDPFHLFEMGLTNNSTFPGGTGDESLVMAANLNLPFVQNGPGTYDLNLYDSAGLGSNPSAGWSVTSPLASMGSGYALDALANVGGQLGTHSEGNSTAVVATWTNIGGGQFSIDYQVFTLDVTGPSASDTVTGITASTPGTVIVDHGFSDLTSLMPSVGYRAGGSDIPTSGAAFDWNDDFELLVPTDVGAIPEASSILALCGLLFSGFMIRRR